MSQVGLLPILTFTRNVWYRVPRGIIPVEGRKGKKSGPKEKLNCSIILMTTVVNTTGRSGARLTLESSPELGLQRGTFYFHVSQSFSVGHPKYPLGLCGSLPLSLISEGTDSWRLSANNNPSSKGNKSFLEVGPQI